ncbi:hypothetical protein B0J13DRAFT_306784 [Dactylonectria estremocensis]|uniref:Secreted protein n=1 Tax=Dactylonectria estremocensis TaxID=1079267 RepID=A0A9P9J9P9_9HYPO|nr:hypothetical protein B0J13DRAFT_306784 [Dactylonectria estremocensis]
MLCCMLIVSVKTSTARVGCQKEESWRKENPSSWFGTSVRSALPSRCCDGTARRTAGLAAGTGPTGGRKTPHTAYS